MRQMLTAGKRFSFTLHIWLQVVSKCLWHFRRVINLKIALGFSWFYERVLSIPNVCFTNEHASAPYTQTFTLV